MATNVIAALLLLMTVTSSQSQDASYYPSSILNIVRLGGLTGKNYFFSEKQKMSWMEARTFCRDFGMDLVSIETQRENDLIVEHFNSISVGQNGGMAWTSGNKIGSWNYMWLNGENLAFEDWGVGEPSSFDVQHCIVVLYSHWYDAPCERPEHFICEQR